MLKHRGGVLTPYGAALLGAGALTSPFLFRLLLGSLILASPDPLRADGGTLRAANVPMGAYRVSVFTDPTPITPDFIDVSVLVTLEGRRGAATGLEIEVVGRLVDGTGREIQHPATRDQAEDPRYYAAKFALGVEGLWELRVKVKGAEGEGETVFRVRVQEPGLLGNPYLILTVALVPLLLVGWWLKRANPPSSHPGG